MNTTDVLCQAKELLSDESRWCRTGRYAVDINGFSVQYDDPSAIKWCTVAAISKARGANAIATPELRTLAIAIGLEAWGQIFHWQDRVATHEQLMDAFDRALIMVAEEQKVLVA